MSGGRRVYLETFGCQMNVLDSELVLGGLLSRGYALTEQATSADVVILNTCSVRQHAEDKVYSRLGALKSARGRSGGQIVAVIGCMAERDGDRLLEKMPLVDILCGPSELHRLPALIEDVRLHRAPAVALSGRLREMSTPTGGAGAPEDLESLDTGRAVGLAGRIAMPRLLSERQAYVRITRGCNKHCTFCVVPYTRGPEVHRPPERIVEEVRRLALSGVMEVTLLGQTVNHYHYVDPATGRQTSFARLLRRVHDEVPDLPRLRFVTSFPRDFTDEALASMAECPRICRYLHVPAQSGSDAVLRRMNRGYGVAEYLGLLDRARAMMPDLCIAGDMIVGFPGETEADFQASLRLLERARYKNCYIFKYSPRPGTPGHRRMTDDVPEREKRRRNNEMLAVQARINLANHREWLDRTVEVLVEGPSKRQITAQESEPSRGEEAGRSARAARQWVGRTRGDQIVVFEAERSMAGELVHVRIDAATPYSLHGRLEEPTRVEPRARPISLGLPVVRV